MVLGFDKSGAISQPARFSLYSAIVKYIHLISVAKSLCQTFAPKELLLKNVFTFFRRHKLLCHSTSRIIGALMSLA